MTIIGTDTLGGRVQDYARVLGVYEDIDWKGKLLHDSLPSVFHEADILLLTSLYEGQGVVVMEAFAAGVVVAGTRVGMLADLGDERITVAPGDADGLAGVVEELLAQPALMEQLRRRNRVFAEEHDAASTCTAYMQLYNDIAGLQLMPPSAVKHVKRNYQARPG